MRKFAWLYVLVWHWDAVRVGCRRGWVIAGFLQEGWQLDFIPRPRT